MVTVTRAGSDEEIGTGAEVYLKGARATVQTMHRSGRVWSFRVTLADGRWEDATAADLGLLVDDEPPKFTRTDALVIAGSIAIALLALAFL